MKKIKLTLIAIFIATFSFGQEVLFEEDVLADTLISKKGPNRKHFYHFFISYGFIAGESEGAGSDISYGLSNNVEFGFRYKLKVCNFYSIGCQALINTDVFHLKQNDSKILPDTIQHDKEKLTNDNLSFGVYNRFNFGKRGNYIGNFLDVGAYGDWRFYSKHCVKDKISTGEMVKISTTHLNYLEDFNYGVYAQIGINRYVVYAKYRLSDIFLSTYSYSELPRITVGLQIGFHK